MARSDKNKDLHLEMLKKYNLDLSPDGQVIGALKVVHYDEHVILSFRDEGPNAWADSYDFSGPAWLWSTFSRKWEFWENGGIITAYQNLNEYIVNIKDDGVHVTECFSQLY